MIYKFLRWFSFVITQTTTGDKRSLRVTRAKIEVKEKRNCREINWRSL